MVAHFAPVNARLFKGWTQKRKSAGRKFLSRGGIMTRKDFSLHFHVTRLCDWRWPLVFFVRASPFVGLLKLQTMRRLRRNASTLFSVTTSEKKESPWEANDSQTNKSMHVRHYKILPIVDGSRNLTVARKILTSLLDRQNVKHEVEYSRQRVVCRLWMRGFWSK